MDGGRIPLDDESAIRSLITAWHVATRQGDLEAILPLMDEDVVFLVPGRPPMRGREEFASSFRSVLQHARIDTRGTVHEVRVGGDLAYCWTDLTVKITPKSGAPVERSGPALTVLRRNAEGAWVVLRDANLLAAGEPR
jgi:uncharacterized protein (TIGR02246 family)